jgi:D-tyrosyl-tRNA(Tyr) deacylase
MRAVVQRVKSSKVVVEDKVVGKIGMGFNVLLGVEDKDEEKDLKYLVDKIVNLRVFEDSEGKMNLSIKDVGGEILAISQFTLLGDCRKGRRPSFIGAARPDEAKKYYDKFIEMIKIENINVESGIFQAEMMVEINNDGPVTILLDSKKTF